MTACTAGACARFPSFSRASRNGVVSCPVSQQNWRCRPPRLNTGAPTGAEPRRTRPQVNPDRVVFSLTSTAVSHRDSRSETGRGCRFRPHEISWSPLSRTPISGVRTGAFRLRRRGFGESAGTFRTALAGVRAEIQGVAAPANKRATVNFAVVYIYLWRFLCI